MTSTAGCAYRGQYRSTENSAAIELLLKAGAIPMVRGNCSQGTSGISTTNCIYGESRNPLKQNRSCGSSGGDAGLVASRCVPLAISSDQGEGLRSSAAFCGIYGFKPSQPRVSNKGVNNGSRVGFSPEASIQPTVGALGTTIQDLISGAKILFDPAIHMIDSQVAPVPWLEDRFSQVQEEPQNIKIGMLEESKFLPLSESAKRAMKMTEDALKELGYQVVPFSLDEMTWRQANDFYVGLTSNENQL